MKRILAASVILATTAAAGIYLAAPAPAAATQPRLSPFAPQFVVVVDGKAEACLTTVDRTGQITEIRCSQVPVTGSARHQPAVRP